MLIVFADSKVLTMITQCHMHIGDDSSTRGLDIRACHFDPFLLVTFAEVMLMLQKMQLVGFDHLTEVVVYMT